MQKKTRGRPKGKPTCNPSLRCDQSEWSRMLVMYKGKVNKMFNEWLKSHVNND